MCWVFVAMEKLRIAVKRIAYTPPSLWLNNLNASDLSIVPLLFLVSSLYSVSIRLRHHLYNISIFRKHRLPVPVISVGNLTWGGNGKTPMVEFLARSFANDGISSLILTRGYGGADEAKMLQRQLQGISSKIGVGANRVAAASRFLELGSYGNGDVERSFTEMKAKILYASNQIGVAILDDGMQHLSVWRNLEIVMVNALMPWGNHLLLPLGPLREPLTALCRADIVVIHHADMIPVKDVDAIESTIHEVKKSIPIFSTKMFPTHFFLYPDPHHEISLNAVDQMIMFCLSGIGFANSFIKKMEELRPAYMDHLDFNDHHKFQLQDIELVQKRLEVLESKFGVKPIVVVTEKDYDRAPEALECLKPYEVWVLCCRLQFLQRKGQTEESFRKMVKDHL